MYISSITIGLATGLLFDTVSGAGSTAGTNPGLAFTPTGGTAGAAVASTPTIPDGATSMTVNFSPNTFGQGTFTFEIDVDRSNNDNVNANQFEGSKLTITFTGPFTGSPLSSNPALTFNQQSNYAVTEAFSTTAQPSGGGENGGGEGEGGPPVTPVPEPATLVLFGLCAAGAGLYGYRRSRTAG